jgi:hypothetical protein
MIAEHLFAFFMMEIAAEKMMHQLPRDEVAMLFAEDTDLVKQAVKETHAFLIDGDRIRGTAYETMVDLPFTKIVDTPHFAAKADSAPLQLADLCAYLITRRLRRDVHSQRLFEIIAPQICWSISDFGEPLGSELLAVGRGSRKL